MTEVPQYQEVHLTTTEIHPAAVITEVHPQDHPAAATAVEMAAEATAEAVPVEADTAEAVPVEADTAEAEAHPEAEDNIT